MIDNNNIDQCKRKRLRGQTQNLKSKKFTLSILITAIVFLSYTANAQLDTSNRYKNRIQIDTTRGNNVMNPDSGYNKSNYNHENQLRHHPDTMVQRDKNIEHQMKSGFYMMKDGKMVIMKEGKTIPLNKDVTMKNGNVLMINGKYKNKDGTTMMMKEGDMMDMNGKITTAKTPTPK